MKKITEEYKKLFQKLFESFKNTIYEIKDAEKLNACREIISERLQKYAIKSNVILEVEFSYNPKKRSLVTSIEVLSPSYENFREFYDLVLRDDFLRNFDIRSENILKRERDSHQMYI